ncbi:MAG TPA: hypothetical protein VJ001_03030 [Rhodocyclaceae bacterium]|nr:hypothetical protein [Rhodocyclaceae bacterium]
MLATKENRIYKTVGKNGQVSLGKEFAGALVEMVQLSSGALLVRRGEFVSEHERRMLGDGWSERIQAAQAALEGQELTIDIAASKE